MFLPTQAWARRKIDLEKEENSGALRVGLGRALTTEDISAPTELRAALLQVSQGVEHLHSLRIVHRYDVRIGGEFVVSTLSAYPPPAQYLVRLANLHGSLIFYINPPPTNLFDAILHLQVREHKVPKTASKSGSSININGMSPPFMRLAEQLTALPTWRKSCLPGR